MKMTAKHITSAISEKMMKLGAITCTEPSELAVGFVPLVIAGISAWCPFPDISSSCERVNQITEGDLTSSSLPSARYT